MQHAQEVLETRDRILQEARDGAERLRMEAEALFRQRLDEHEITVAARNEGRDIVAHSQQQAKAQLGQAQAQIDQRRQELEEYSLALLRRLETNLSSQLETVRGGISGILEEKSRLQPHGEHDTD